MNIFVNFLKNLFLATGAIWFFSALAIIILNLNFGPREIAFTLIIPFAYAVVRIFDKVDVVEQQEAIEK
jgi:hypothetical protein